MRFHIFMFISLFIASNCYAAPNNCNSAEHRSFDFWLGEWQVTTKQDNIIRASKISLINKGCTLLEEYSTPSGYQGKSLNIYDKQSKKWHQTWTDSSGTLLLLTGQFANNQMILSGESAQNGKTIINRITWTANPDGTVRQHWQTKQSAHDEWQTAFDGLYVKK